MHRIPVFIKWLVITVVSLGLLTAGFFLRGQQQPDDLSALPDSSSKELKTLLVQLAGDDKSTGGLALFVKEEGVGLRIFNISPNVVSQFGEAGLMTVAEAGTQVSPSVVAEGISTATGIRIDGTLTLQRLAIAGLVDSVGGVEVNPDSGLLVSALDQDAKYVPPGRQLLDGQHAAGYALVKQFFEDEDVQVDRMNEVLRGIFNHIPVDSSKVDETISALGSLARSNVSTSEIAKFFVSIKDLNLWASVDYFSVITDASELELMAESQWLRVRQPDTWKLLVDTAPRALTHFSQTKMRVEVAGESPADRSIVAGEISQLGFNFIDGGYNETPEKTTIRISAGVDPDDVNALKEKLGLTETSVTWDFTLAGYADVRIVLGTDYLEQNSITESVN